MYQVFMSTILTKPYYLSSNGAKGYASFQENQSELKKISKISHNREILTNQEMTDRFSC